MNCLSRKQARKIFTLLFFGWTSLTGLQAEPTGPEIVAGVKTLIQSQKATLTGQLRTGPSKVPFTLAQADGASVYQFQDPAETIRVAFTDDGSTISGVDDPKKTVRGSILTYDDLALRFLYWKDIQIVGTEKIRGLPCWELRLAPPNRNFAYGVVHLWVNKQSGAFLRADAYDWDGKKTRNFEVTSTQKDASDHYILKQMRITDWQAEGKPFSYLEILPPK